MHEIQEIADTEAQIMRAESLAAGSGQVKRKRGAGSGKQVTEFVEGGVEGGRGGQSFQPQFHFFAFCSHFILFT
jgi:hypothetical protein